MALRLLNYVLQYSPAREMESWQTPKVFTQSIVIRSYLGHQEQKYMLIKTSLTNL